MGVCTRHKGTLYDASETDCARPSCNNKLINQRDIDSIDSDEPDYHVSYTDAETIRKDGEEFEVCLMVHGDNGRKRKYFRYHDICYWDDSFGMLKTALSKAMLMYRQQLALGTADTPTDEAECLNAWKKTHSKESVKVASGRKNYRKSGEKLLPKKSVSSIQAQKCGLCIKCFYKEKFSSHQPNEPIKFSGRLAADVLARSGTTHHRRLVVLERLLEDIKRANHNRATELHH